MVTLVLPVQFFHTSCVILILYYCLNYFNVVIIKVKYIYISEYDIFFYFLKHLACLYMNNDHMQKNIYKNKLEFNNL